MAKREPFTGPVVPQPMSGATIVVGVDDADFPEDWEPVEDLSDLPPRQRQILVEAARALQAAARGLGQPRSDHMRAAGVEWKIHCDSEGNLQYVRAGLTACTDPIPGRVSTTYTSPPPKEAA